MTAVEWLHPPISLVDRSFVEDSLIPAVQEVITGPLSAGGVFLFVVDAGTEGDYVVGRIRSWALSERISCVDHWVAEEDPFLLWSDLMGHPEIPGLLAPLGHLQLILVTGSCWVPVGLLTDWLETLSGRAKAACGVVVLPVLRSTGRALGAREDVQVFSVPPFKETKKSRREELCRAMLGQQLGEVADLVEISKELLHRDPSSRTELQGWVEGVAEVVQDGAGVPDFDDICGRRLTVRPGVVASRDRLRGLLIAAEEKMFEADAMFQEWQGRVLLNSVRRLADPFLAMDSLSWFVIIISHISCRLDCVDGAFWFLVKLTPDATDGLVCGEEPEFFRHLRSLRTLFQHGLVEDDRKDRETIEVAETWFRHNCGVAAPERQHWRRLSAVIVKEWHDVVSRLAGAIAVAPRCSARATVTDGMNRATRRLARHQWRYLADSIVQRLDAKIDVDRFLEKYHESLAAELRRAPVSAEGVRDVAGHLVESSVVAELAVCPVTARDLMEKGVTGGRLGVILREANRIWKEEAVDRDNLWKRLTQQFGDLEGA